MDQLFTFISHHWMLCSAWTVALAALLYYESKGQLGGVAQVAPNTAVGLLNREKGVLLDVREPEQVAQGHILGAINVPLTKLAEQLDKLKAHQSKPIIVTCASGQTASKAGAVLVQAGFNKVYNLQGGMQAWQNANLPVVKTESKNG
jgi:rhodanese-related sulfurtransferase